jgi:RNA polymerase sigma-70 factor (ECF subfamily)
MEQVLESVAPSIRRFAVGMCKNDADAEDVVQDALISIATNLDSFEGRSAFATWAFTLARTACGRRRRGLKNRPAEGDDVLAAHYRSVLLLRDGEGLTAPEAAEVLDISVDALKSRLHRARAALREALAPVLEGDAPRAALDCPDVVAALSRKLEDELDAEACAEMEKHVESCARCTRTCDALKSALRACRSVPGKIPENVKAEVKKAVAAWIDRRADLSRQG